MAKLCPRGKAAAKRKFKVYPSAYANMYASGVCSGKIKPGGRTKKAEGGKVKGKRRFKSIKEIEDYGKQAIASLKGIGDSLRDKNTPMKKQRLLDRVKKMGGGMMTQPRAMYGKGGGVCIRGMNRDAIGKNS